MKTKILIIDDEQELCDMLGAVLEEQGFEVTASYKVTDIFDDFDIVLADVGIMRRERIMKGVQDLYPNSKIVWMTGMPAFKHPTMPVLYKPFNCDLDDLGKEILCA